MNPRTMTWLKYLSGFLILATLYQIGATLFFIATAISTTGVITQVDEKYECHQDTTGRPEREKCGWVYRPIIQFEDRRGQFITIRSKISVSNSATYIKGHSVKILYDEKNPFNARMDNNYAIWGNALMVALLTLIITGLYWHQLRKARTEGYAELSAPIIEKGMRIFVMINLLTVIAIFISALLK